MTNRLPYPNSWAEGGVSKDPDTDTTHTSYLADRYSNIGWKSEKPPEEWQNFLSSISDQKIIGLLEQGIGVYDSSVTYPPFAIIRPTATSSVTRINMSGGPLTGAVPTDPNGWLACLSSTDSMLTTLLSAMQKLLVDHLAADNPHNDKIGNLVGGGYEKEPFDNFFLNPNDNRTIVWHKAQTGRVHSETPEQVGTLPDTGGSFTGPVIVAKAAKLSSDRGQVAVTDSGTLQIKFGNWGISIDSNGDALFINSAGSFFILTRAKYSKFETAAGYSFSLPLPLLSMNLECDISDATAVGMWTITTNAEPVYESGKGFKIDTQTTTLTGVSLATNFTLHVIGHTGADKIVGVVDINAPQSYVSLNQILTAAGISAAKYIKQVVFYPVLTSLQKSMLVV